MLKKIIVSVFLVAIVLSGCMKSDASKITASNFTLQDLNGKTVKLSDFKGKPVLIDFWATWCPPCRASVPAIEKLNKTYSGKGLVVLGISLDQGDWESVKAFAAQNGVTYTILKGDENVIDKYHVRTIPMLVILNKEGNIAQRYIGFDDEGALEKDIKAVL